MKIGIFFGGSSREREVSFAGGRTVFDNLDKKNYQVPAFEDLQRLYMHFALRKHEDKEVYEEKSSDAMTDALAEGLVLRIASEQQFVTTQRVIIYTPLKTYKFTFELTSEGPKIDKE